MEFRVMISMPAMIVPFERLTPKHKNNTTYRGLEATDEKLYQMLSENGIEALYDDREETHWDSIKWTLGEKNLKKGLVEIKKRRTGEIFLVKREEVISKIQEMITEEMMV